MILQIQLIALLLLLLNTATDYYHNTFVSRRQRGSIRFGGAPDENPSSVTVFLYQSVLLPLQLISGSSGTTTGEEVVGRAQVIQNGTTTNVSNVIAVPGNQSAVGAGVEGRSSCRVPETKLSPRSAAQLHIQNSANLSSLSRSDDTSHDFPPTPQT